MFVNIFFTDKSQRVQKNCEKWIKSRAWSKRWSIFTFEQRGERSPSRTMWKTNWITFQRKIFKTSSCTTRRKQSSIKKRRAWKIHWGICLSKKLDRKTNEVG